ncbi:hypothetical protein SISNIDRAFT_550573 [Sistotremastrum niveocremeum HHB9708]|uniref:Cytoplasmic tRNA 2-thiolation protein 2 n=2 Tax=Sistotremastraceae TaxID=3402574 RepID=A0A164TSD3_9AGAM|nr:hypothetical protein SISNIDRAFT_550573 [Sistotremastrum niveocremeum HHB9708]KZT42263.1 hypothetical protein SISSUDRAFT_999708 [Sistotremastrum suecicum HHB10207 ss-3]
MSCEDPSSARMIRSPKHLQKGTCIKCKTSKGKITIRHAVYCKECFFSFIRLKFRRGLEPYINADPLSSRTKLKASGNLTLALSGGMGSVALLDLIYSTYLTDTSPVGRMHRQKIWPQVYIVFVDLSAVYPEKDEMRDLGTQIQSLKQRYPEVEMISARIESVFDRDWWTSTGGSNVDSSSVDLKDSDLPFSSSLLHDDPVASFQKYLSSLPTSTSITASIDLFIRAILVHLASWTRSSHLLMGTSLTSLSVGLINCVSQGGGYHVHEEQEEVLDGIRIIRPLRDTSAKEVAYYAWWSGLDVPGRQRPTTLSGIKEQTRAFIFGLDRHYPSTVSAITKTCAKVEAKSSSEIVAQQCRLCRRPIQDGIDAWKHRIAIRERSATLEENPHFEASSSSLGRHLCYPCHTTLSSPNSRTSMATSNTILNLPVWTSLTPRSSSLVSNSDPISAPIPQAIEEFLLPAE